jgi:hypothetical protein
MNEFKENLQLMKESFNNIEDNPAIISSHPSDNENKIPFDEDSSQFQEEQHIQSSSNQRNERGRRKRNGLKERLDSVLAENRAKDAERQQLMTYVQEQERRLAEAEAKAQQNAHYSNIYYEKSLENEEQRVLTELELAKESGDIKQEIALQKELAKVAAQQETQLLSKTVLRQNSQQPQLMNYQAEPQPQYQQQNTYQEPVNEYFEEWLEEHPWANPHSPEFDQNLSQEVNEIAVQFNKHLKFNGAGNVIGTPDYYNALSKEMNNRYMLNNNNNDEYYDDNQYVDNSAYEVAPVTKRGSSMADRYVARNQNYNVNPNRPSMAVRKDEFEAAEHLKPALEKVYGRPFTIEESLAEYYKQKQSPRLKEILREMNYQR